MTFGIAVFGFPELPLPGAAPDPWGGNGPGVPTPPRAALLHQEQLWALPLLEADELSKTFLFQESCFLPELCVELLPQCLHSQRKSMLDTVLWNCLTSAPGQCLAQQVQS